MASMLNFLALAVLLAIVAADAEMQLDAGLSSTEVKQLKALQRSSVVRDIYFIPKKHLNNVEYFQKQFF